MRILVVDDNRDILDLVQRVLLTYNYDVVIARDGLEALAAGKYQPARSGHSRCEPANTGWMGSVPTDQGAPQRTSATADRSGRTD